MIAKELPVSDRRARHVPRTRVVTKWVVVAVLVVHGLLHLLGAAKGFGWADVPQLVQPIGTAGGVGWLIAGLLVLAAGLLMARDQRWWWVTGAVAVVGSQAMLFTSWSDAKAGTAANVVLLGAVVYGYASLGPHSLSAEYHRRVASALGALSAADVSEAVVTEADLTCLPAPVAAYVRRSGAVGQPRVTSFRARIHGRIRGGAEKPWMRFVGEQVNTYGPDPSRLFFIDATMLGLPVDVLHVYVGSSATMRVRAASLFPILSASGSDPDRAETVTMFNDLCVLAPAALLGARVTWQQLDDGHVRGAFTNGVHTVSAVLVLNDEHDLVDFVSEDRLRASADSRTFTRQRWSTPVSDYRTFDSQGVRRTCTRGEARWHAPEPEGDFAYLEFELDDLAYNTHEEKAATPVGGLDEAGLH